jgi:aminopeptidase N
VGKSLIIKTVKALVSGRKLPPSAAFAEALGKCLASPKLDDAFKALMLVLPSDADISAAIGKEVDSDLVHQAREAVRSGIAKQLLAELKSAFDKTAEAGAFKPDTDGTARRSLRYTLLSMIAAADGDIAVKLAHDELNHAHNMTTEMGALVAVLTLARPEREQMLADFLSRHHDDHLLIDKWFMLNATIPGADAARRIEALLKHPDFKLTTPNRVYALVANFANGNATGFNAANGEGYRVVADVIIALNAINPQVAARIATAYRSWRLYDVHRRNHAQREMQRILATKQLSNDVFEIISRTLKA